MLKRTLLAILLLLLLQIAPNLEASSGMDGIGRGGMLILRIFIILSLIEALFVAIYFGLLKKQKIKNNVVKNILYAILILYNIAYLPLFLWVAGELIF